VKRFICEPLKSVETEKGGVPVSFKWKNREYRVDSVLRQWQDYDYSSVALKKTWRTRRHRNYFRVRTDSGATFEIYCDRGTKLAAGKHWVMASELGQGET
jgi:hypothetical protein